MQVWLAQKGFLGVSLGDVERPGGERAIMVTLWGSSMFLLLNLSFRGHGLWGQERGSGFCVRAALSQRELTSAPCLLLGVIPDVSYQFLSTFTIPAAERILSARKAVLAGIMAAPLSRGAKQLPNCR